MHSPGGAMLAGDPRRVALHDNPTMPDPTPPPRQHDASHAHKGRCGLDPLRPATLYSLSGLRTGWTETAFRQEAIAAIVLLPLALWLGQSWVERALLAASVLLVLIVVELLDSGIRASLDRVALQCNALSKRAKDLGSAAVMLILLLCIGVWDGALSHRWGP